MGTYERALFLMAGIVSGICPFILSAHSGESSTVILQIIAGSLVVLAGDIQPDALVISLCAGLVLLTAALFRINRGEKAIA